MLPFRSSARPRGGRTALTAGLGVATALLAAGCGPELPPGGNEGDCAARIGVDGRVLDPVGARPQGRRGEPVQVDVLGCDEETVASARARPITRDGEVVGYAVLGDWRGFYSTDSVVEPVG